MSTRYGEPQAQARHTSPARARAGLTVKQQPIYAFYIFFRSNKHTKGVLDNVLQKCFRAQVVSSLAWAVEVMGSSTLASNFSDMFLFPSPPVGQIRWGIWNIFIKKWKRFKRAVLCRAAGWRLSPGTARLDPWRAKHDGLFEKAWPVGSYNLRHLIFLASILSPRTSICSPYYTIGVPVCWLRDDKKIYVYRHFDDTVILFHISSLPPPKEHIFPPSYLSYSPTHSVARPLQEDVVLLGDGIAKCYGHNHSLSNK